MKSVKVNYIYNLIYKLLLILLPLITIPYTSRVLNPDGIGIYNYTNSIVCVFVLIASLGTSLYAQKEIAYAKDNINLRSNIFKSIFTIRFIMSILITLPYILFIIFSKQYKAMYIVQYIFIIANLIDISWLLQGIENFKDIALKGIFVKILSVLCIFLFVKKAEDLLLYTLIMSICGLINSLLLWPSIKGSIKNVKITKEDILKHIKPVFMLALPVMAIYVYTYVDKVFLGILSSEEEVGFYSQSENIVKASMTVITALGAVLLPRISNLLSMNKMNDVKIQLTKAIDFVIMIGLPMVLGFMVTSSLFVPWFLGDDYASCVFLLQLLSPLIMIIGLASVTGQAVLIPLNKQKIYTLSICIGAILNVCVNILLIPKYSSIGASIGTLIAETVVTTIQQYYVFKLVGIKIKDLVKGFIKPIISVTIMTILLIYIKKYFNPTVLDTLIYIGIGGITYFAMLFILKDNNIKNYINMSKKKK